MNITEHYSVLSFPRVAAAGEEVTRPEYGSYSNQGDIKWRLKRLLDLLLREFKEGRYDETVRIAEEILQLAKASRALAISRKPGAEM